MPDSKVPNVAIKRLPVYLRVLEDLNKADVSVVSSVEMARRTGFSSEQIRKDLAYFGAFGTRGVGYSTDVLIERLRRILGLNRQVPAVLVGAGNLGRALARYNLERHADVRIVVIFDNDPLKIGTRVRDLDVKPVSDLEREVVRRKVRMGIIAVPAAAAQEMATRLVKSGVRALLNFAPLNLRVDPEIYVQNIDLSIELQSLAYYTSQVPGDRDFDDR